MTDLTFKIDLAGAQFPAKSGYEVSQTKFIESFETHEVTPEAFLERMQEGRAYCSAFHKRHPATVGRPERYTAKVDENFAEASVITMDLDEWTGEGDPEEMIKDDPFFKRYGYAIVHSSSSTPEKKKLHVVFILTTPITDPDTYRLALKALTTSYTWSDPSCVDLMRTFFNGIGTDTYINGKLLPFQDLWKHKVAPYQRLLHDAELEMARVRERNLIEWEARPKVSLTQDRLENYVSNAITGILDELAGTTVARNRALTIASFKLASLAISPWAAPVSHLFAGVEDQLVTACHANGYEDKYGRKTMPGHETKRVYRTCQRACNDPRPEPLWLNTPLNREDAAGSPQEEVGYGAHVFIKTSKTDDDIQAALDARYMEGYNQGYLDGYIAGLEQGGRELWELFGVDEMKQTLYELGYDPAKMRLTIPSYDQEGRLLNIEYHTGADYGWEVSWENETGLGSLYQPDTSITHSDTTLLVPDSISAIHSTFNMAQMANHLEMEPMMIYSVPPASRIPECSALLGELDTNRIVMIVPLQDDSVDDNQLAAMSNCCRIIRPAAKLEDMIKYNRDFSWLERMINMA